MACARGTLKDFLKDTSTDPFHGYCWTGITGKQMGIWDYFPFNNVYVFIGKYVFRVGEVLVK